MTNQETVLGMDFGLPVSAIEDSEWWQKMLAVPTLLVGNAHFLKDSPPPILPQWQVERHLVGIHKLTRTCPAWTTICYFKIYYLSTS